MQNQAWFLLSVAVASFILYLFRHFVRYGRSQGPYIYPFVGNLFEFLRNVDRLMDWMTEYFVKLPSHTLIFKRPGDDAFVITANPANVEHILKIKFENYPKGEHVEGVLRDLLGDGIFIADGKSWKLQRRLASFEFTTRSLRDFLIQSLHHEISERLVPTLKFFCDPKDAEIDLQDVLVRFAFDNICKVSFGVDPSCLDPSFPTVKFAAAFDTAASIITARYYEIHPLVWKMKRFFNIGSERKLRQAIQVVDEFASFVIEQKRMALRESKGTEDFEGKNLDLLSRFMCVETEGVYSEGKEDLDIPKVLGTDKFVRDIVISFILAGKDSTSAALTWFFWILASRPDVEQNICNEVASVLSRRPVSGKEEKDWIETDFCFDELKEMHYLHAAISESMRLYPPVPLDTKEAKHEDVLPDGTKIEQGMKVTYHVYGMGRVPQVWGKDCLEFKPERWLKDRQFVGENPYKYPVFQAGPRICLGKDMAMIQMKYVCAVVVPNFKFVVKKDHKPKYGLDITLRMINQLPVRVERKNRQIL